MQANKTFIKKYSEIGKEKFYNLLIIYYEKILEEIQLGIVPQLTPDVELINLHDRFLNLYRKTPDQTYLDMAIIFRKAAHKAYRKMLKYNLTKKNNRFLNLVINGSNKSNNNTIKRSGS